MFGPINRMFLTNQLMNHLLAYMISSSIKHFLIFLIKSYKYMISGFFPNACRFVPSCSNYTVWALKKHGVIRGCWLAVKRISKCHPFYNTAGYDPVP